MAPRFRESIKAYSNHVNRADKCVGRAFVVFTHCPGFDQCCAHGSCWHEMCMINERTQMLFESVLEICRVHNNFADDLQ